MKVCTITLIFVTTEILNYSILRSSTQLDNFIGVKISPSIVVAFFDFVQKCFCQYIDNLTQRRHNAHWKVNCYRAKFETNLKIKKKFESKLNKNFEIILFIATKGCDT